MTGSPDAVPGQSLDAAAIFDLLQGHGVDYVVVGGLAGMAHGSSYPTFDLDIAYARDDRNLEQLASALRELDATLTNAPADLPFQLDAVSLRNGANFTFDTKHGRFDILGYIDGVRSYDDLRADSQVAVMEGHSVRVSSIDHLIAMKRAANRPKDRNMLEEYIVIADEQSRAHQPND